MKPKVTVLMPVYNGEKYLKESIESILNQTFTDFEFLIINDGSIDNTFKIIKSYKDPRIRLLENEKNLGLVATRNRGIKESLGEFIALLDSDDVAYPKRLKKQINFLESHSEFGIVGSWINIIDANGKLTSVAWKKNFVPEKIPAILLFHNYFTQSSITLRKSALPQEWYRPGFSPAEDYDIWIRVAEKSKTWSLPEILVKYRIHENNIVKKENSTQQKVVDKIISSQLNNLGIFPNAEELKIHRTNYSYSKKDIRDFIQKREQWLKNLKIANANKKFYLEPTFSEVISAQWLTSCNANASLGFWILKKFWQSPLKKINYSDLRQIIKFLIKCLFKK